MKAIGMILAGGDSSRMGMLTRRRAVAAMPIAGSYRAIDFPLSNLSNSHVKQVAVLTQYHARSLYEHLNSSKWWDFGRKHGGLYVFSPVVTREHASWYRGTADAIYQNLEFLTHSHEPYVIVCSGDAVYKMDYNQVLQYHVEKEAELTVVCHEMSEQEQKESYGTVKVDETMRIQEFEEKPVKAKSRMISCGIYIMLRKQLIELVAKCVQEGRFDFVQDILIRYKNAKRFYAYPMKGYWRSVNTVETYFQTNLDFLRQDVQQAFFAKEPYIYSKVTDLPPAKYNTGASVHDALISGGCIINSVVGHSVLFPGVFVGKGSVVKNSIVLNDVYIGEGVCLENCIVQSHSVIRSGTRYGAAEGIHIFDRNDKAEEKGVVD